MTASNIGKLLVTEINDFSCTFFGKLKVPRKEIFSPNKRAQKISNFLKPGNLFRKCLLRWQDISLCLVHIILSLCISFQIIAYKIVLVCISSSTHFFKGQRNYSFIAFLPLLLLCIEDPKIIKSLSKNFHFVKKFFLHFFLHFFLQIIFLRNFQRILLLVISYMLCYVGLCRFFSSAVHYWPLYYLCVMANEPKFLDFYVSNGQQVVKCFGYAQSFRNSFHYFMNIFVKFIQHLVFFVILVISWEQDEDHQKGLLLGS